MSEQKRMVKTIFFIRLVITALYLTYRLSTRRGIMIFNLHQFYSLWHDQIEYSWFESFTQITYTKLYLYRGVNGVCISQWVRYQYTKK